MAAYVIAEVSEVLDIRLMGEYRSLAQAAIERYGGRYLVRDGAFEIVEGDSQLRGVVIVEFPTMEKVRKWYHSAEYAHALSVSQKTLKRRLIFVEGVQ